MKYIQLYEDFVNESNFYKIARNIKKDPDGRSGSVMDFFKGSNPKDALKKAMELDKMHGVEADSYHNVTITPHSQKDANDYYSANESADYDLKDDSGGGKATLVLKLEPAAWEKVKHLFDDKGRPNHEDVKRIPSENAVWDLYAQEYESGGKKIHKIYGVSGDYTFGNAPTYYQQKLRGNKKAARRVYDYFINKFLK